MMNSSSGTKTNQNIQVYVRVRPTNARERSIRSMEMVDVPSGREVIVRNPNDTKMSKKFTFDKAFGPDSKQSDVYSTVVAPLIEEVLCGYNCTVFAYGQTGTGKTYTMIGDEQPELKSSWEDENMIGIIPRALNHLFDELRMMEMEFSMRISYLELYNEELCDLLSSDDTTKIRIFDDANKKGSVIVQGLEEIPVHSKDDVYKLLAKGQERRKTAATLMNAQSSRSHTVFSILVHIRENGIDGEEMLKTGKLNLVDLAGSENISKAGNEKGIRTRETVNINQSLLTLGRVITALVERQPHVPYRESKLTRLLQESLGGRTKTSIIATISPGHKDLEETLSTLDYAYRAKNIQNKPEINQRLTKKTVLKEYTEEIDRLKRDLMASRDKNGIYLATESYNDMQYKLESQNKELNDKLLLIKALKDEMLNKQKLFAEVSLNLVERTEELKETVHTLNLTNVKLGHTKKKLITTKKRYEEKKHVVSKHLETEHLLTEQGKELIKTAEIASNDTYGLHETLNRRRTVDEHIKNVSNEFVGKINNRINDMQDTLNNFMEKASDNFHIILDDIHQNVDKHAEFSNRITSEVDTIDQLSATSRNEILEIFTNYKIKAETDGNDYLMHENNLLKSMMDQQQKFHEKTLIEINLMKNLIQEKDNMFQSLYSASLEHVSLFQEIFGELGKSCVTNYGHLSSDITKAMEKQIEISQKTVQNTSVKKQELTDIQKQLTTFMTGMQQFLDNVETENTNSITDAEYNKKFFVNKINEEVKSILDVKEKLSTRAIDTNKNLTLIQEGNSKNMENYLMKIDESNEIIASNIKVVEENVAEFKMHRMNNRQMQNENLILVNEMIVKSKNNFDKEMVNASEASRETIRSEKERINGNLIVAGALIQTLDGNCKEYETSTKEHLSLCQNEVDKFYSADLKIYRSTGETPARKEFQFPKTLAATSPHDRIIRRFRIERGWPTSASSDLDTSMTVLDENQSTIDANKDEIDLIKHSNTLNNDDEHDDQRQLKDITPLKNISKIPHIRSQIDAIKNASIIVISSDDENGKENIEFTSK